ncbi:phosphotransferase [Streptomyces sp. NPDC047072]|uniref:phosphotransferase n=1 Tax=Streptomyces sp. NPDC047072 TaxID=3154809 RepID=UPI0033C3440F
MLADEDLLRSLLREQHPDLAHLPLGPAIRGWANELWRLGGQLAIRLPRTPDAPDLILKEQRWLPALAPLLPLPVPVPVRLGRPTDRLPALWAVVTWIPGDPADRVPVTRADHAADALADFLRALHRPAPADAPVNPDRGVPLAVHAPGVDKGLRTMDLGEFAPDDVRRVWEAGLAAPAWAEPARWLHGDLHPANVVVADGTFAGVIDFGELCAGDPATDLAAAWLLLPDGAAPRFFKSYGTDDQALIRRARAWAIRSALGLLTVGQADEKGLPGGKPTWGTAGRAALRRVLTDDPPLTDS